MAVGTPDPNKQREIQAELIELRRRIAELEHTKQQLDQHATSSAPMAEVAPPVTTLEELSQTLQAFVRRVAMIMQADKCVIMLYEPDTGELVAQHPAQRLTDEEITSFHVPAKEEGLSGDAFRSGHPVICRDCQSDPRAQFDLLPRLGIHDALTVPMQVERRNEYQQLVESTPIGVIHVFNKRYSLHFTDEDISLLTVLARNAAAIISSARTFMTLTREKMQLESALQSMSSGLLAVSTDGHIKLMNPTAGRILNASPTESLGLSYTEVIENEELQALLSGALAGNGDGRGEFACGERFYQVQTALARDEGGNAGALLCVFSDVTDLRNVERLKTDFVSTVSHELRTPLTAIKGFIRTLLDDPSGEFYDHEIRMEFYGIIDSECDRLIRLINDLLNVSRIERGLPLQLNYSNFAVESLIDQCLNFHRGYTQKHTLVTDISIANPNIVADKDKLDQVLSNLISNAIKYSPDGGDITISVVDEGNQLRFGISDQGMGIPPEHLDRIFQRFHRVHSGDSQLVSGTGIGLFLAKSLVEAHGGLIWVVSTVGEGSTFFFTILKQPPLEIRSA